MNILSHLNPILTLAVFEDKVQSELQSKVFLFIMTATMCLGGLCWGCICLYFNFKLQSIIPFSYVILSFLNIYIFKYTRNFNFLRVFQVFISLILPIVFQIVLGGLVESGGVMLWGFLALVGSMTFQNLKQSYFWLFVYLTLAFLVSYFNSDFQSFAILQSRKTEAIFISLNIISVCSILFALLVYFLKSRNFVNEQLVQNNKLLENKIAERTAEIKTTNTMLAESNDELTVVIDDLLENNQRTIDSLLYAQVIQSAILNHNSLKACIPSCQFVYLKASNIVSGDFYWNFALKNKRKVVVATVDCTGHGVPGALMSLVGDNLLNQIVCEKGILNPKEILEQMDLGIKNLLQQEASRVMDGMDMAIVVLDFEQHKLEFAGANSPLLIITKGEVNFIKGSCFPIGGISQIGKIFTNHTIDLQKESMIYLYSDGYADQFGCINDKKFLSTKFRNLLLEIHQDPIEEQLNTLNQEHLLWKGNLAQTDDILVVGIQVDALWENELFWTS